MGKLLQKHGVETNVLATVGRETTRKPLEVYGFLKEQGVEFVQFAPVVERAAVRRAKEMGVRLAPPAALDREEPNADVTPWSVVPEDYGDFLIAVYEEWGRKDVGKVFVMNFEWALNALIGDGSPVCVHAKQCGRSLVIEHNGDVYACDHCVYPRYRLGNIVTDELSRMAAKSLKSGFAVIDSTFDQELLSPGCVHFLNIQKLGKDKSLVTRADRRMFSIWETITKTTTARPKSFFLILDEAHRGMAETPRSRSEANTIIQKFIKGSPGEIPPIPLVVGISATPDRFNRLIEGTGRTYRSVPVPPEDVRLSGLLKEVITLHHPNENQPSDMTMLRAAARSLATFAKEWHDYCEKQGDPALTINGFPVRNWTVLFGCYALVSLLAGIIALRQLPETRPVQRQAVLSTIRWSRPWILLLLITLATGASWAMITPIMVIFLQENLTADISVLSRAFLPAGLVWAIMPSRLGSLADRFGRKPLMLISLGMAALSSIMIPQLTTIAGLSLLWAFQALCYAAGDPAEQALVADLTGGDQRCRAYGFYVMAADLGAAFVHEEQCCAVDADVEQRGYSVEIYPCVMQCCQWGKWRDINARGIETCIR